MEAWHADLKEFVTRQDVVCKTAPEDKGLETWQAEGDGKGLAQNTQKTQDSINEGKAVYYKLRVALPRSFTVKSMEEVYQDLCMVKHAANLAKQEILECVADQALGWLWIAFKKIHSDDLSKEACHVDETRVMGAVRALKFDHMKFPQPLESITKPSKDVMGRENQQESSDCCHDQKICHFKRLSEAAGTTQPPEKRLKKNDENSHDREYDKDSDGAYSGDVEDVKSWKEFYKRKVSEDTRIAYLSEFFKFLQTVDGGCFKVNEALENTCHVLKMMEALESGGHTIDCLLDRQNIWDWVEPRIEAKLSARTLQKYLFSLEKFYDFISCCRLPAHIPQFSEKTKSVASILKCVCPRWRRIVAQIACKRKCKRLLVDPVNPCASFPADADTSFTLTQNVLGEHSGSAQTSSNESKMQGSATMWPRRKKWRNEDVQLLLVHFKRNPGKAAIRKKMTQDEELEALVKREGLNRCYEKVKSLYREKKVKARPPLV